MASCEGRYHHRSGNWTRRSEVANDIANADVLEPVPHRHAKSSKRAVITKMAIGSELKDKTPERVIGRYAIYDEIASGGMAVVHLGRMLGQAGFSMTVAVKRLHPQFAKDPSFVAMFLDEARLAVRVQHPNVVAPLDVLVADGEVLVVMEYVAGDTLARLQRSSVALTQPPSPAMVVNIMSNALHGLHAAHEALSEDGRPLHIVHRDISPQNIMVGTNGIARVLDFGVARAAIRSQATSNGEVRGKLAYMAPEQLEGEALDARVDVFAAGIVVWELLTQRRLFNPDKPGESMARIVRGRVPPVGKYSPGIPPELDQAVLKALRRDPRDRHQSARDFAVALERACPPASPSAVADWVKRVGGDAIAARAEHVAAIETQSSSSIIRRLTPPPRVSGMVPVQVLPLPIDSEAAKSQARITIPLVRDSHSEMVVAKVPSAMECIRESTEAAASDPTWALSRRMLAILGTCLVAGIVACVLVIESSGEPVRTTAAMLPRLNAPAFHSSPKVPEAFVVPSTWASVASSKTRDVMQPGMRAASVGSMGTLRSVKPFTAKPKTNCSPPYFVDAKGIRRLRPECI